MTDKDIKNQSLEALFEEARATPPQVPDALMAQVLKDADAQMPRQGFAGGRLARWARLLGGGPGLGGLVAASCLGFWIGLAAPAGVPDIAAALGVTATEAPDDITLAELYGTDWISGIEEAFEDE